MRSDSYLVCVIFSADWLAKMEKKLCKFIYFAINYQILFSANPSDRWEGDFLAWHRLTRANFKFEASFFPFSVGGMNE
jgi:hypothetical protein